ncbi:acyl-CoA synthetase (AMP-forming)/AMP-acid ligase II [Desulfobotulus alkaliphilus]|uniref:Acyl-CoA synthetase (AMP-forming)/AMP-acid ligase II n=1 Tax=Desulfobotulus alkaliphilus TaxID=622671 RepID=A0A562S7U2_9BACT|nr:fatty acid CoA ligase family protein [Desulfobotulus alkaliphilus]TWI77233.1 acyl-CoA synthetase (AMP-forming)/AMP-acid ligase II [Desulfobotulus alkaliphilus]
MENANIACLLTKNAAKSPNRRAVVMPAGKDAMGRLKTTQLSFAQLDASSTKVAAGFSAMGMSPGTRTVLMVPPGMDFFILTFALFKAGLIPVVVDPGMGVKRMADCLASTRAEALVGIPKAHLFRKLFPRAFAHVRHTVSTRPLPLLRTKTLKELLSSDATGFETLSCEPETTAAILFTTGSTGPAKGVIYTHANFHAQIQAIQNHFDIKEDDRDLPTFPLFALFDPALGMTAFIPEMDPTKPGKADPRPILEAIDQHAITTMFCSPALLDRLGRYGSREGIRLPGLRRVVSAGAPVRPDILQSFVPVIGNPKRIHTPYGATEAVPLMSLTAGEILSETRSFTDQGMGICVGRPLKGVDISIIRITDAPIASMEDAEELPEGEIGEIIAKGPMVTSAYYENPEADRLSKIKDQKGFWHRMGDLAWKDNSGRFWFCGRKSHRVCTEEGELYTLPCEAIFNTHKKIRRSALVGIGPEKSQTPVIIIEPTDKISREEKSELQSELLQLAGAFDHTSGIRHLLFHRDFPVDIRHNAKIHRESLAAWAEKKLTGKTM